MSGAAEHYVSETLWDNLGKGWRMHCNCGWATMPCNSLQDAGEDMDEHLRRFDAGPPSVKPSSEPKPKSVVPIPLPDDTLGDSLGGPDPGIVDTGKTEQETENDTE